MFKLHFHIFIILYVPPFWVTGRNLPLKGHYHQSTIKIQSTTTLPPRTTTSIHAHFVLRRKEGWHLTMAAPCRETHHHRLYGSYSSTNLTEQQQITSVVHIWSYFCTGTSRPFKENTSHHPTPLNAALTSFLFQHLHPIQSACHCQTICGYLHPAPVWFIELIHNILLYPAPGLSS